MPTLFALLLSFVAPAHAIEAGDAVFLKLENGEMASGIFVSHEDGIWQVKNTNGQVRAFVDDRVVSAEIVPFTSSPDFTEDDHQYWFSPARGTVYLAGGLAVSSDQGALLDVTRYAFHPNIDVFFIPQVSLSGFSDLYVLSQSGRTSAIVTVGIGATGWLSFGGSQSAVPYAGVAVGLTSVQAGDAPQSGPTFAFRTGLTLWSRNSMATGFGFSYRAGTVGPAALSTVSGEVTFGGLLRRHVR